MGRTETVQQSCKGEGGGWEGGAAGLQGEGGGFGGGGQWGFAGTILKGRGLKET